MDRKTATLFGAAAALAAGPGLMTPAAAQESPVPSASSYAELLQPIDNAQERLAAADSEAAPPGRLIKAQYVDHHHHHHHHHHHSRRWYRLHGYYWYNGGWVVRPAHHHHHHHHQHY